MKTTYLLLSSALLLGCVPACNTSGQKSKEMKTDDGSITTVEAAGSKLAICDLPLVRDTIEVPLGEFVEDCRIIHFETPEEAYFKAWFINATDSYIGIRQGDRGVFKLLDRSGKFLYNIGSVGSGPGEYDIILYDEYIDEKNGHIFFTPFVGKRIMMYDINGQWIKDIQLPMQVNKPKIWVNEDGSLPIIHIPFNEEEPLAFQMDTDGNILKQTPATAATKVMNLDGEILSYRNCNDLDFFHTSIDTLFTYDSTNNRLLPRFTITFPNMNEKPIYLYYRLPHHFIVTYWGKKGAGGGDVLVDTKKNASSYFHLVNDFYGNFPVSALGHSFYRGYFIQSMESGQLIEKIEKHLASDKRPGPDKKKPEELAATLNENDNNVLFIGKVKE